jgi:lactobin A/cerein 7B family class IIb bacteriocin
MEITEIDGSMRELTTSELTMVAGGGPWWDLGKIVGGVVGSLLGGPLVGGIFAANVVSAQEVVKNYDPHCGGVGCGPNVTPIEDAAL